MEITLKSLADPRTVSECAQDAVASITGGEADPIVAYVNLGKAKRVIDEVMKNAEVMRIATDYIEARGASGEMTVGDCSAKLCEAGVSYDYSVCGDPELERLYAEAEGIKERIKARETFLRGIDGHLSVLDENTGEVRFIYPPARTSRTTIKLTFKK